MKIFNGDISRNSTLKAKEKSAAGCNPGSRRIDIEGVEGRVTLSLVVTAIMEDEEEKLTKVEQPIDSQSVSSKGEKVVESVALLQNDLPEANFEKKIENENTKLGENEVGGRKLEVGENSCIQADATVTSTRQDGQHIDIYHMQTDASLPPAWSDDQREDKADIPKVFSISGQDELGTEQKDEAEKLHFTLLKEIDDKNGKTAYCSSTSYLLENQSTASNADTLQSDLQTAEKCTTEREILDKTVSFNCKDKHDMVETETEGSTEESPKLSDVNEIHLADESVTTRKDAESKDRKKPPKTESINLVVPFVMFLVVLLILFGIMIFMFTLICGTKIVVTRKPADIPNQNKSFTVQHHVKSLQNESFSEVSSSDKNYSKTPNYRKLLSHMEYQKEPSKHKFHISKRIGLDFDVTDGGNLKKKEVLQLVVEEENDDGSCLRCQTTTAKQKNWKDGSCMTLIYSKCKAGISKSCRFEFQDLKMVTETIMPKENQTLLDVLASLKEPRRIARCLLEYNVQVVAMPPRSPLTPDDNPVQSTRLDLPPPDLHYTAQDIHQQQAANPVENRNRSVPRAESITLRHRPRSNRSDRNTIQIQLQDNNYVLRNATYPPVHLLAVDIHERSQITQGNSLAEVARRFFENNSSLMTPASKLAKGKHDNQQQGDETSIDGAKSNVLGGVCEPLQSSNHSSVGQEENDANSARDSLQHLQMEEFTRQTNLAVSDDTTSDESPPEDCGEPTANIRSRIRRHSVHVPGLSNLKPHKPFKVSVF